MSLHSGIEWTKCTFNYVWGCTKVSSGCDHCYAEREAVRYGHQVWGKDAPRREMSEVYWHQPLKWNRDAEAAGERWRVFCGSHCDVMEEGVYLQGIRERQLYPLIEATPQLDWLLLTKRPQNFRRFLPKAWLEKPLPNVMGMTSVETEEYRWRIEVLTNTRFARRGLSLEPLLGDVDLSPHLAALDWVIVGGESGPGARPMSPNWARNTRDQCVAAGVPFWFKQWGAICPWDQLPEETRAALDASGESCPPEGTGFPRDVFRVGRKLAGALLDGREWREVPR